MTDSKEHRRQILVVDDEQDILELINLYLNLSRQDCDVFRAESAKEALEVFYQRKNIEIVITDIRMPGELDGLALTRKLRSENPNLRILVITACTEYTEENVISSGANLLVRKPFTSKILTSAIDELLS